MAFERTLNVSVGSNGQSLENDQSPPEGTQGGTFCNTLLVSYDTKRAVASSSFQGFSMVASNTPTNGSKHDFKVWEQKDRRAYHRILSGYKVANQYQRKLRFMTLTTSYEARKRNLKEDTNTLVKRIRRRSKTFEYFRVRTNEGNGVVHVLYRGSYIPRSWLKAQWEDIHQSWNVDIRACQRYHAKYVVNQYICEQEGFTRYSMSGLWLPKGSLAVWHGFCKWYYKDRVALWDAFLHNWVVDQQQSRLVDQQQSRLTNRVDLNWQEFYLNYA